MRKLIFICMFLLAACAEIESPDFDRPGSAQGIIDGDLVTTRRTVASRSVVGIEFRRSNGYTSFIMCGGSIVSDDAVLTAAHCFDEKLVGRFVGANIVFGETRRPMTTFAQHPQYNSYRVKGGPLYDHDLAVVRFAGGIPEGFNPVPLDNDVKRDYSNEIVYVYGYGRSKNYTGKRGENRMDTSGLLRRGIMRVDQDYLKLGDRYYVSGRAPTTVCQGDSGGPQFFHQNGVLKQIGITSSGRGLPMENGAPNCKAGSHATRVSYFYSWIRKQLAK